MPSKAWEKGLFFGMSRLAYQEGWLGKIAGGSILAPSEAVVLNVLQGTAATASPESLLENLSVQADPFPDPNQKPWGWHPGLYFQVILRFLNN